MSFLKCSHAKIQLRQSRDTILFHFRIAGPTLSMLYFKDFVTCLLCQVSSPHPYFRVWSTVRENFDHLYFRTSRSREDLSCCRNCACLFLSPIPLWCPLRDGLPSQLQAYWVPEEPQPVHCIWQWQWGTNYNPEKHFYYLFPGKVKGLGFVWTNLH